MSLEDLLRVVDGRPEGLTSTEASARDTGRVEDESTGGLVALAHQFASPLNAVLAAGAAVSAGLGAVADVGIIAAVIGVNTLVGAWQERQAGRAAEALDRLSARRATVIRDGREVGLDAGNVVIGDVLVLAGGD